MNKYKKACRHITISSTILTALFHFVCCGLPSLMALVAAIFGLTSVHSMHWLSTVLRTNLLIVGGILLTISFVIYYKEKDICENTKAMHYEKIILFTSAILFAIGLISHIISMNLLTMPMNH